MRKLFFLEVNIIPVYKLFNFLEILFNHYKLLRVNQEVNQISRIHKIIIRKNFCFW